MKKAANSNKDGTTEAISRWELKSSKVCSMLGRLLDTADRELYTEIRDPKELWERLEKIYAGKDEVRIWLLPDELSKVEYHEDDLVDYISSLKLFYQLAAASEFQATKDKKYLLLSKLPLKYHPFRTTTWNNSKYDETTYNEICDHFILEHQQLRQGNTETEATDHCTTSRALILTSISSIKVQVGVT